MYQKWNYLIWELSDEMIADDDMVMGPIVFSFSLDLVALGAFELGRPRDFDWVR